MKFNALVVAAMAIASVNAVWYDELPSGDENSGGRSTTVVAEGSSGNGQGKVQVSEPTEKDQICDSIKTELGTLWGRSASLESEFQDQLPEYLNLMKGIGENGRRIKKSQLGSEQAAGYLALGGEERGILGAFKVEYAGVTENYGMIWGEFSRNVRLNLAACFPWKKC
ncbi:hypothetical protein BASA83_007187 [Batrachochytrium salamandrivorans]|nr:hypothetical protein BASA83_007187 [Batrachochytrium salamandrivorans]